MISLQTVLLLLLMAGLVSWAMAPLMRVIAVNAALFDRPTQRKIHATPTPLLGGMALFLGMIVALAMGTCLEPTLQLALADTRFWLLGAAGFLVGGGLLDDAFHWPAWQKLFWQICSAGILVWGGMRVKVITHPMHGTELALAEWVSILLTVGWLVAMINAINLMDGLDGLACGMTAIIACFLLYIAYRLGNPSTVYLLAAVIGSCLGFLRYNWPPARMFMGDTGSQLLGLLIGAAPLLEFQYKAATAVALMIPLTTLAIPLSDVILAIVRRLQGHRSIFRADKQHLHHRLLDLGLSQQQVILVLYGVTAYLGLIAILFILIPQQYALILMLLLGLGMFMGMRTIGFIERRLRLVYLQQAKRRRR